MPDFISHLATIPALTSHPRWQQLAAIIGGETNLTSSGYPYISDHSFALFRDEVPHLFGDGLAILDWLHLFEELSASMPGNTDAALQSMQRAIKVIRTMVFTAAITAPTDLWLLRHVLASHRSMGILEDVLAGRRIVPDAYSKHHNLDSRQLEIDLHFLHARGYLNVDRDAFFLSDDPAMQEVLNQAQTHASTPPSISVQELAHWLVNKGAGDEVFSAWFEAQPALLPSRSWYAGWTQIELGYRLVPLVLSLRVAGLSADLKKGIYLSSFLPERYKLLATFLAKTGLVWDQRVTALGDRVFTRGPGPFGIIHAYYPYMERLEDRLQGKSVAMSVSRGENVAASQDANRKTFEAANDALDQFCNEHGYQYRVFVEHAVGQGEASRQRYERSHDADIRYFGADLEDAAIDEAVKQQALGKLPEGMQFIRQADIGKPERVIEYLDKQGLKGAPTVMMVGNGFHEIRHQSNEKMIEVFKAYQQAGFVLIFTEESGLSDDDLLNTAWNTYHAGFRYVHEMSGQGLRPIWDKKGGTQWGWRRCAEMGGYIILDKYAYRSRTIYPFPKPDRENPAISVTYFCVPLALSKSMGLGSG